MAGNKSLPTVDEIINSLKRSSIPIILIEGNDDAFIYRWLKSHLGSTVVSLQPCGGRTNLFTIYDRKSEFSDKNVVFVADKDAYRFLPIPTDKSDVIFTTGYCIETDIYEGSNISHFLDDEDLENHRLLRNIIGKWFAFEVEKLLTSQSEAPALQVSDHINVVSPPGLNKICQMFSNTIEYAHPSEEYVNSVFSDYNLNIRGKQLFQMLSRFLSYKGRFSRFNDKNLIEIALKQGGNEYLERLVKDIKSGLNTT
tara:strand:- start:44 stop:805 length:762 start_codon:yes stop_codon:yes gene_type:complete